jgi:toxin ParE1/3/4
MSKQRLRVVRERLSEQDLLEQIDYLRQENVSAALRFVDAIEHSLNRLSEMPEIGSPCDFENPRLQNIRMWPVKGFEKYLIFYRVTDEAVQILRVLHGARDILNILE